VLKDILFELLSTRPHILPLISSGSVFSLSSATDSNSLVTRVCQVRKPKEPGSREDENPVPLSPCPISGELIPTTSLECPTTKDPIPMCVVTGQHITSADLCLCPRSGMPALYSQYLTYIETEVKAAAEAGAEEVVALDPVTESPVRAEELVRLSAEEAAAYIAKHNMDKDEAPANANGPASPSSRN